MGSIKDLGAKTVVVSLALTDFIQVQTWSAITMIDQTPDHEYNTVKPKQYAEWVELSGDKVGLLEEAQAWVMCDESDLMEIRQ
jgi:hypothetical protein